jgi:NitT/TauT family transport system permease protein
VVAVIAAGSGGAGSGLAYRIAESGSRLIMPRWCAAVLLLSLAGIVCYFVLAVVSQLMRRRWHDSAGRREV